MSTAGRQRPGLPGTSPLARRGRREPAFDAELRQAQRYERRLLLKAHLCLLVIAMVAVLRQTFLLVE